jgi:ABC-type uncharacterized transport system permease subunit
MTTTRSDSPIIIVNPVVVTPMVDTPKPEAIVAAASSSPGELVGSPVAVPRRPLFGPKAPVGAIEALYIPFLAVMASLVVFGIFLLFAGANPLETFHLMYVGAFGSTFSWQNTLVRASPLLLTGLCAALPLRLGMVIIGGEGALVLGGLFAGAVAHVFSPEASPSLVIFTMMVTGATVGGIWISIAGALKQYRGVNETISSLLLNYIAIALLNHMVNGLWQDPANLNNPSTWNVGDQNMMGNLPFIDVHWGLGVGVVLCLICYVLMNHTTLGFAASVVGGNIRAAKIAGLSIAKITLIVCFIAGAAAGLAGVIEVAAVNGAANASLAVGYGYAGILVAFIARSNPMAIIPVAILLGGIAASNGVLQRQQHLPDATVLVLQGILFVMILGFETLYGRFKFLQPKEPARG